MRVGLVKSLTSEFRGSGVRARSNQCEPSLPGQATILIRRGGRRPCPSRVTLRPPRPSPAGPVTLGSSMPGARTLRGEPARELLGRILVPAAPPVVAALEPSNRHRPGNGGHRRL